MKMKSECSMIEFHIVYYSLQNFNIAEKETLITATPNERLPSEKPRGHIFPLEISLPW